MRDVTRFCEDRQGHQFPHLSTVVTPHGPAVTADHRLAAVMAREVIEEALGA